MPLDAKDTEIQRLHDELQASKDYSQVCEDESVELRRQLFDMTKQMKKLNKELERLSVERATQPEQKKSAPASRKRSGRKTTGDSAKATETETLSDAGSDSANSGGDHSMEDANAPRRSARRAGLRPEALSMAAVEAKPKRKASARTATASPDSERPAPASSKKKRVDAERAAATVSSEVMVCGISSADSEGDKELPKPVVREERALGESRQVTGGAGGMGEHPDPLTEEEQAPAAPPATESMQRELLNVLGEANLQLQAGWLPRMRALQQLKMLLTTPGMLKCDEAAYVEEMMRALVVQTSDARSQIVREACGLITDIMPFLAGYHCQVANILLPQLWKLSYITIKVMSESGNKCLLSLIRMLPIDLMVASISEAAGDAHSMCRAQAAVSLNTVLQRSKCKSLEDELDAICTILSKLLEDTSADVRTNSKAAFESLLKSWPARGKALMAASPDNVQRMLKAAVSASASVGAKSGAIAIGGASKFGAKAMDFKKLRMEAMQKFKKEKSGEVGEGTSVVDGNGVGSKIAHQEVLVCKENVAGNRI